MCAREATEFRAQSGLTAVQQWSAGATEQLGMSLHVVDRHRATSRGQRFGLLPQRSIGGSDSSLARSKRG